MADILPTVRHAPLEVRLAGTLGDVLHGAGGVFTEFPANREGYLQRLRYWCSSLAFARLCRIRVEVEGSQPWLLTPLGPIDDIGVLLWVGKGQRVSIGLQRGEDVDPLLVPAFADIETFRLEAFG